MNKVILTQAQANAIETLLDAHYEYEIVSIVVKKELKSRKDLFCLYELDLDALCRALYVGYEVEKTSEEQLLEYFKEFLARNDSKSSAVIEKTLKILNIKIKGIND